MSTRSVRYSTFNRSIRKGNLASTDRDALAFLEAAQIYNTNQQRAIVNLVRSLKRVGLWSKMKAIYPFVGGTAASHKWNLKDPRDQTVAFSLVFNGGWTHNANGITPNGTNAYADTFYNPSTQTTNHISNYIRTSTVNTFPIEIGIWRVVAGQNRFNHIKPNSDYLSGTSATALNFTTTISAAGFWLGTKRSDTDRQIYRNGVSEASTSTFDSTVMPNGNLYIGARNGQFGTDLFSTKQMAFVSIGDGLTNTDATNLYNIVDSYQKRLGRAV